MTSLQAVTSLCVTSQRGVFAASRSTGYLLLCKLGPRCFVIDSLKCFFVTTMTCKIEWEDLEVRTCKWFVYLIINSGFLFNLWHTFDKLELCLSLISCLNNLSFIYLVVLIVSMGIVIDSACFSISFLIPFLKRRWESCWDKEPLEKFTLQSKSVLEFRYGERGVNE